MRLDVMSIVWPSVLRDISTLDRSRMNISIMTIGSKIMIIIISSLTTMRGIISGHSGLVQCRAGLILARMLKRLVREFGFVYGLF